MTMAKYIDRDDLRERMYHASFETNSDLQRWDSGCWIRYHLFEIILDSIPVSDVKPVIHGEWVKNEHSSWWHCSVCHKDNVYAYCWNPGDAIEYTLQDNFCPNCGADMRQGKE